MPIVASPAPSMSACPCCPDVTVSSSEAFSWPPGQSLFTIQDIGPALSRPNGQKEGGRHGFCLTLSSRAGPIRLLSACRSIGALFSFL